MLGKVIFPERIDVEGDGLFTVPTTYSLKFFGSGKHCDYCTRDVLLGYIRMGHIKEEAGITCYDCVSKLKDNSKR